MPSPPLPVKEPVQPTCSDFLIACAGWLSIMLASTADGLRCSGRHARTRERGDLSRVREHRARRNTYPQVPDETWSLLTVSVVVSISQSIHAATSEVSSSSIVGAAGCAYVTETFESVYQLVYV